MLRFYGAPMSSAGRCHWLLEELQLPYEHIVMGLLDGSTRQPEFLRINKAGTVPVIDDDGFILVESLAINSYLAEKHRPELLGSNLAERALVQQWSLWALTNLQPHLLSVMLHSAILPEARRDAAVARASADKAAPLLAQLDQELVDKSYFVAGRFTLADLNVASVVVIALASGMLAPYREVGRWMSAQAERPAFRAAFPLRPPANEGSRERPRS